MALPEDFSKLAIMLLEWTSINHLGTVEMYLTAINGRPVLITGRGMYKDRLTGKQHSEAPKHVKADAIGIDWMTMSELDEAIPPVYSKFLAEQIDLWR